MKCNSRTRKVVHGCATANTNSYFIVFEVIVKLCVDGLRGVRRAFVGVSAVRAGGEKSVSCHGTFSHHTWPRCHYWQSVTLTGHERHCCWTCVFCNATFHRGRLPRPTTSTTAGKTKKKKKKVSLLTNDAFTAPELHIQSHHYLILAEISPQSLYVLGCVADLRGQTRGISHLGVFLVNIFHFSEGLAEERREKKGDKEGEGEPGLIWFHVKSWA